jgi:hypothetical protein
VNRIRRPFARRTGLRPGQLTGPAARRRGRPGRDGFAGRFIQDIAAAASVAAGQQLGQRGQWTRRAGQNRPAIADPMPWLGPVAAPGRRPHTVQLCIHCGHSPAGFWVSLRGGQTVRRPWCLSCCQVLDRECCDVIPFAS